MKNLLKRFVKEESAQGATEYILLLVVVVGIAVMFRENISNIVRQKVGDLGNSISGFNVQ